MSITLDRRRGIAATVFTAALQTACGSSQAPMPAAAAPASSPEAALSPAAASARFLVLRETPGHFSGGRWRAEVDAWGGAKHRVMEQLAQQVLQTPPLPGTELRRLMGAPDEVLGCPSADCSAVLAGLNGAAGRAAAGVSPGWGREAVVQAVSEGGGNGAGVSLWLYDWRGRHDRLVFVAGASGIRAAAWFYAGE
ncbi:hypothetical protein OOT46_19185 [Aquabacterium sp. A7-Y]|uniref:hypothetical protein n=1 Tax=Aquabacterium sp. A7-Y TaxID=1349605 RepID=UPI00223CA2DA|nr:hypothetical protein [Aquabacterium sp. A7-Y]MCW7539964.1 hypothetical protein [Aquabacterium sp. A7-Y]